MKETTCCLMTFIVCIVYFGFKPYNTNWIITMDIDYYPWIEYYDNKDEAKKNYNEYLKMFDEDEDWVDRRMTLCQVHPEMANGGKGK